MPAMQSHIVASFEQHLAWLIQRVPDLLQDSSIMSAVMQVSNVPSLVAAALLRNGAHFTWQQLQDAASSLVPGLQVWADVCRALELQLHESVPSVAAAVCCGDELDLQVRPHSAVSCIYC
jgi:hypothetical protein